MPRRRRRDEKPLQRRLMRFWWRFVLVALLVYIGYSIWLGGAYRDVDPFVAGECVAVDAPPGPEDLVMLPDGSAAIVSAQDRRDRSAPGALWYYDLRQQPGRFTRLETPGGFPFHPHGIALHQAGDGQIHLQVINHRSEDRHTVEIFTLHSGESAPLLRHRGSVASGLFVHPNGIAAAGPEAFYVTNDRGSGPRWMHMVENLLQLSRSNVVYHDGRGARIVAEDIAFANGVELSADGNTLLVGSTLWRMMLAYTRDPRSGALVRSGSLALPGGVDNIHRDAAGDLWVAVHVNSFAFIGHAMNADKQAPSQVLRLDRDGRGSTRVQEAFGDPGDLLSAASAAVHHAGRVLIGAVFDSRILDCRIDPGQMRDAE